MNEYPFSNTDDFEETLQHLQSDERLGLPMLYALSAPTREKMKALAGIWPTMPAERRRHVTQDLVDLAEANFRVDFRRVFRHLLDDPDPQVRAAAIDGLWEDENHDLIERFCHMLEQDVSADVRAGAAQALGKYVLQAELDELEEEPARHIRVILRDVTYDETEAVEVRRRALESIAYHDHLDTREMIRDAYEATSHPLRVSAIFAMGRSVDPYWSDVVLMELDHPSPEIRFEAARASGELRLEEAVPALIELLHAGDREIQEVAIWALGQVGGKRAKQVLNSLLHTDDPELTRSAEDALGELLLMEGELGLPLYSFDLSEDDEGDLIELDELDELDDLSDLEEPEDWETWVEEQEFEIYVD